MKVWTEQRAEGRIAVFESDDVVVEVRPSPSDMVDLELGEFDSLIRVRSIADEQGADELAKLCGVDDFCDLEGEGVQASAADVVDEVLNLLERVEQLRAARAAA